MIKTPMSNTHKWSHVVSVHIYMSHQSRSHAVKSMDYPYQNLTYIPGFRKGGNDTKMK